jgi:hypothetical protein
MSRYISSFSRIFLALLLSATFFGNWAVCASVCEELTDHHAEIADLPAAGESCLASPEKADSCPITAPVVILQDRQTVEISAPLDAVSAASSFNTPDFVRSAPIPEARQNAPPGRALIPLFVRLCTFRI